MNPAWLLWAWSLLAEPVSAFEAVMQGHVQSTIGVDALPGGAGIPLVAGMFVSVGPQTVQIYDHEPLTLAGAPIDGADTTCARGCAPVYVHAFERAWLRAAVESASFGGELPTTLHFIAHRDASARALVEVAYAAAETRPAGPPNLSLVVAAGPRSLVGQPFFLLPPAGLRLQSGAAALGLVIEVEDEGIKVTGADSSLGKGVRVRGAPELQALLAQLKKKHPGKTTVVFVPGPRVRVGPLVDLMTMVRAQFERVVFSLGQPLTL